MDIGVIAIGVIVVAALAQVALGIVYLIFGRDSADRHKGVKRLMVGGTLVLLIVLLAGLPACAPFPAGQADSSQVDPETVRSVPPPSWAWPVDEWLNMDWDLWSCPTAKGC